MVVFVLPRFEISISMVAIKSPSEWICAELVAFKLALSTSPSMLASLSSPPTSAFNSIGMSEYPSQTSSSKSSPFGSLNPILISTWFEEKSNASLNLGNLFKLNSTTAE